MRKNILTKVILIVLAVAAASLILYKCSDGFAEGMNDAKEHRDSQ